MKESHTIISATSNSAIAHLFPIVFLLFCQQTSSIGPNEEEGLLLGLSTDSTAVSDGLLAGTLKSAIKTSLQMDVCVSQDEPPSGLRLASCELTRPQ
jgi:hypothetical protein